MAEAERIKDFTEGTPETEKGTEKGTENDNASYSQKLCRIAIGAPGFFGACHSACVTMGTTLCSLLA
ncbi:hypothetical protein GCM10011342_01130 [Aquisalinus flavus]|uniref:Uncharacterized protein n=1 Tax=Aquisalinus flavus TaxID=1526572 RepID=A0A8J2V5P3_9PROT|nr:hypothetical protein GCM10011342_01130 [Aquisalinus flavus]